MELDWTTFILEIINFVVLVWLLRHFLYRPVMNVVAERRAAIAKTLEEAKNRQDEATALKAQYENRLQDWQKEREAARGGLRDEIEAERRKRLARLDDEVAEQRRKEQVLAQRREEALSRTARHQAMALSGQFAARLLARLADPSIQARLLSMLLEDLGRLPDDQRKQLSAAQRASTAVQIISAFPLNEQQRSQLSGALDQLLGGKAAYQFEQDAALQAGFSIHIGAQRLQANLREELRFFGDGLRDEG